MRSRFDCEVGCVDRLDGHSFCFCVQISCVELGCIDGVLRVEADPLPDFPAAVVAVQVEVSLKIVLCLPFTITQSGLIFPFFARAGLHYLHRPFLRRSYFHTDTRLFMGGSFPPLERIPESLGEY